MPVLDQSVAMQVVLSFSNISTPVFICSIMVCFDSLNASWCSCVQMNLAAGFRRSLNGAMVAAWEKVYATWFTRPNHDLTSVVEVGVGNSAIALVNFLAGLTVVGPISNPAN